MKTVDYQMDLEAINHDAPQNRANRYLRLMASLLVDIMAKVEASNGQFEEGIGARSAQSQNRHSRRGQSKRSRRKYTKREGVTYGRPRRSDVLGARG